MISVIVTVGPNPAYMKYLDECIQSILDQDTGGQIMIVDDGAHLQEWFFDKTNPLQQAPSFEANPFRWTSSLYLNPWNLGQAASINIGCALAYHDWLFIMGGCDDKLEPGCLRACIDATRKHQSGFVCVYPGLVTSEGVRDFVVPQGVWLIHRNTWANLGGYPREAGLGEVDAMFCGLMMTSGVKFINIEQPLYWHREHPQALTATKSSLRAFLCEKSRKLVIDEWKTPDWAEGYGYEIDRWVDATGQHKYETED